MLMAISQSQNSSLGDPFEVLDVSLAMSLRKMSDILNASKRSIATSFMPWNLRGNTTQTWDRVRGGEQFHRFHEIATNWQTYGIDYDGPLTDIETDNDVVVPESQIQLAK